MAQRKKERDARLKRSRKTTSVVVDKAARLRSALINLLAAIEHGTGLDPAIADARAALDHDGE